jgi:hypothetical protein
MARYRFTTRDLAPLRGLLDAPFAREVFDAAIPIKRFGGVRQREEVELPVAVQSRDQPDGVPLHEILKAVQAEVPGVSGIAVREGKAVLTHKAPLTAAQRSKIGRVLKDRRRLTALRPPRGSDLAAADPEALRKVLLDDATPDAEWLRAFRQYAMTALIPKD